MAGPHIDYETVTTNTCSSKAFRMHTTYELHQLIRSNGWKNVYDREGDDRDEYHCITPEDFVAVIVANHDDEELVIVTQMHQHIDYRSDDRFSRTNAIKAPT